MFEVILMALVSLAAFLFLTVSSKHTYFKNRKVPQTNPEFFYGDYREVIRSEKHHCVKVQEIYNANRHLSYVGFYQLNTPVIILIDPDLIKNVLIKDFNHFYNNNINPDPADPFFCANAFATKDEVWKKTRSNMTPLMSATKIRNLYGHMKKSGENLVDYLKQENGVELDPKDLSSAFATDFVASLVFSVDINSFKNPNTPFREVSKGVVIPVVLNGVTTILSMIYPFFAQFAKFKLVSARTRQILSMVTSESVKQRAATGASYNDLLQQLLEFKKKGLGDDYITAQAFGFFIDVYETSSVVMSFALFELGKNADIQERLRREIDEIYNENNGEIPHDKLVALEYMEMFVSEVLRLHSALTTGEKACTKPYTLEAASPKHKPLEVEVGMGIVIPTYALHMDERYYPNPETFNPENFTKDAIASRHKCTYLPFGEGPRMCYGARMGIVQVKFYLATLLRHFEIKTAPSCYETGYTIDPKSFLKRPRVGTLLVSFHKRA